MILATDPPISNIPHTASEKKIPLYARTGGMTTIAALGIDGRLKTSLEFQTGFKPVLSASAPPPACCQAIELSRREKAHTHAYAGLMNRQHTNQ